MEALFLKKAENIVLFRNDETVFLSFRNIFSYNFFRFSIFQSAFLGQVFKQSMFLLKCSLKVCIRSLYKISHLGIPPIFNCGDSRQVK